MKSYTIPWDGVLHCMERKRLSTSLCRSLLPAPAAPTAPPMTEDARGTVSQNELLSLTTTFTPMRKDDPSSGYAEDERASKETRGALDAVCQTCITDQAIRLKKQERH